MRQIDVGVAGLGAIGARVARAIDDGRVPGLRLAAVSARDIAKAEAFVAGLKSAPRIVSLAGLAAADVVVEGLPAAHVRELAEPVLKAGRILIPLSAGALLDHEDLFRIAEEAGGRIIVPSGAILGLDAIRAAAEGAITSVEVKTRKPPAGLAGAPLIVARGIDVDRLQEPLLLFKGSAREAVKGFPANVNVAAAVSLAGIGPDRTLVEVWADPGVTRNTHTVTVRSDSSDFTMTIENTPSPENPRTGTITAQSVLATLRRLVAPVVAGT